ncbi:MAG: hypothetical protein VB084_14215 [Syntrophomonadaceae bacterium]|nr:hypothetical protein [Syntrophomonadaceae bacterium]
MSKWWIVAAAVIISIIWAWYRGNKLMKAQERLLEETTRIEDIPDEDVFKVSYHGGIPEMPQPKKLNMAFTNEYLLFFNDKGDKNKIYFTSCRKVEKIVTRHDPDLKGKSIVLWGPLVGIFLRVKFRYYIVIDYIDSTNNKNNILLECEANVHKELYANINERYQIIRKALKAGLTFHMLSIIIKSI